METLSSEARPNPVLPTCWKPFREPYNRMASQDSALVVLVVEDEWLIRAEIAREFESAGWRVLEAADGVSALSILERTGHIDALVTDVRLPGFIDGWDLAKRFRSVDPALPVMFASANVVDEDRRVPNSHFFSKPCRPAEIVNACKRGISQTEA